MVHHRASIAGLFLTRRSFLAGASALAIQHASGQLAWPKKVGIQLYSVRTELDANLSGTLHKLSEIGLKHIESAGFHGLTAAQFASELRRAHLTATSMHVGWNDLRSDPKRVISDAKTLGVHQIVCPGLPYNSRLSPEELAEVVRSFSNWTSMCGASGFHFAHHPEPLGKWKSGDGTQLDSVILRTPKQVEFQLDVFWTPVGGDPVSLLRRHPGRFTTTHLKDFRVPVPHSVFVNENLGAASLVLGKGDVDRTAFFAACRQSGITEHFLESESPDAMSQIRPSIDFLRRQDL